MGYEKGMCSSESSTGREGTKFYEDDGRNTKKSNNFSVLIADDDKFTRAFHELLLIIQGMEVEVAENGRVAVELHYAGESFDLIFMELDMPSMNGYEATKALRDMGVHCAIIGVTSGRDDKEEKQNFLEAGFDDCISKPLTMDKMACFISGRQAPASGNENDEGGDDGRNIISNSSSSSSNSTNDDAQD